MKRAGMVHILLCSLFVLVSCSDDSASGNNDGERDTDTVGGTGVDSDQEWDTGGVPEGDPSAECERPIEPADVSAPDHVIGTGTPESCTFALLRTAVEQGGTIAFNCGAEPVTIDVTQTLELRTDVDTVVDGGGTIILDGGADSGRRGRIFHYYSDNFQATDTVVTLQNLTLQNSHAPAEDYTPPSSSNPACAYGYRDGAGGAIYMRDGRLRVIDCVFANNRAAEIGPDTGGGAIYALGCNELTVVGSRFQGNQGSNSGAVGMLFTEGHFVNSIFERNRATGEGANYAGGAAQGCPGVGHENQGGAGGNGGAMAIDGGAAGHHRFCGCVFLDNWAGELGTIFRTPNSAQTRMTFDRVHFKDNFAEDGGGAMYVQDVDLSIYRSTFEGNNSNGLAGAIRVEQGVHGSKMIIENSTFEANYVTRALGGALVYSCGDWNPSPPCGQGVLRNVTFANNQARGGLWDEDKAAFGAAVVNNGSRRTLSVYNTVFLNNTDEHEWTPMTCLVDQPMPGANNFQWPRQRVGDNNIDDDPCTQNVTWADAALHPLEDNGGFTPTRMPREGSVILGAGADCPSMDQRGEPRPAQGCAAGAVEP